MIDSDTRIDTGRAENRDEQTMGALEKALEDERLAAIPETSTEAQAELTPQDEADLVSLKAAPEAVEPEYTNPVSNANVLDLRAQRRAEQEATAKARVDQLQEMADAGESTVTAEALDRQADRVAPEASTEQPIVAANEAPKKKGLLAGLIDKIRGKA